MCSQKMDRRKIMSCTKARRRAVSGFKEVSQSYAASAHYLSSGNLHLLLFASRLDFPGSHINRNIGKRGTCSKT